MKLYSTSLHLYHFRVLGVKKCLSAAILDFTFRRDDCNQLLFLLYYATHTLDFCYVICGQHKPSFKYTEVLLLNIFKQIQGPRVLFSIQTTSPKLSGLQDHINTKYLEIHGYNQDLGDRILFLGSDVVSVKFKSMTLRL